LLTANAAIESGRAVRQPSVIAAVIRGFVIRFREFVLLSIQLCLKQNKEPTRGVADDRL
jgi:hypothetical protein